MSFSVEKSFVSTLVGIAIDEGVIGGVDDPVTDYLPELAVRDPRFERITSGHFRGLDGHLWEVMWNPKLEVEGT